MRATTVAVVLAFSLLGAGTPTRASQLNFTFANPTFGGSALNGTYLLDTAQGQGYGAKSGQSATSVDLSGLSSALSSSSSSTVANPTTSSTTTTTVP